MVHADVVMLILNSDQGKQLVTDAITGEQGAFLVLRDWIEERGIVLVKLDEKGGIIEDLTPEILSYFKAESKLFGSTIVVPPESWKWINNSPASYTHAGGSCKHNRELFEHGGIRANIYRKPGCNQVWAKLLNTSLFGLTAEGLRAIYHAVRTP